MKEYLVEYKELEKLDFSDPGLLNLGYFKPNKTYKYEFGEDGIKL